MHRKFGAILLQVKVHLFGVSLILDMVADAVGIWINGTEQVLVSMALVLHHRWSGVLLGQDAIQL